MRRFLVLCGSCSIALALLVAAFLTGQDPRRSKLYRLLRGDDQVAIQQLDLGDKIKLRSPATVAYLKDAFRASKEVFVPQSRNYSLRFGKVYFEGGGDEVLALYLSDRMDLLVVGFPVDRLDEASYYEVGLREPPEELTEALATRKKK